MREGLPVSISCRWRTSASPRRGPRRAGSRPPRRMRPDRSPSPHSRHNGGREAQAVRRVRPQRPIALHEGDEPLGGQGGAKAVATPAPMARRRSAGVRDAVGHPLERRRADDHRQRDGPREQVGVLAREPPRARGGQRGTVSRHPWDQRRPGRGQARARRRARHPARAAAAGDPPRPSPALPRSGPRRCSPARRAGPRSGARGRSRRSRRTNESATTAARRVSNAASSAAITCRWPISSAAAVPACSATSKLLRASGRARPTASRGTTESATGAPNSRPAAARPALGRRRGSPRGGRSGRERLPSSNQGPASAGCVPLRRRRISQ